MISINTNNGSLHAAKSAGRSQQMMDTAMERLSSGLRINKAKDDAAGQGIATRLTAEIQGLSLAARNAADAQSLIDTAEAAHQEVQNMLLRMRELAVQASNGTLTKADRTALDTEVTSLENEITNMSNNLQFGGVSIAASTALRFQIGSRNGDANTVTHTFAKFTATGISANVDVSSQGSARNAISTIDAAISTISTRRGALGAVSNRLSSVIANLDNIKVNLSQARGRIQDTDFAEETSNLAKSQIMQQAATAMLAQANASKGSVLTLIQG